MDDNKKVLSDIYNIIIKLDPKDTKLGEAIKIIVDAQFNPPYKKEEDYNEPMMLDKDSNVRYNTLRTGVRHNDGVPRGIIMEEIGHVEYFEVINAITRATTNATSYKLKRSILPLSKSVIISKDRYTAQELLNILRKEFNDPELSMGDLKDLKIVHYGSDTHAVMDIYNALSKIYEDSNDEPKIYYIEDYQLPANVSTIMDWCIDISSIPHYTTFRAFSKMIGDLCRGGIVTADEEEDVLCNEDLKRYTDISIEEDNDLIYNLKLNLRNIEELLTNMQSLLQILYKDLRRKDEE